MGSCNQGMSQNVESTKMLLLHNTRETLARLHNRRIRTCAQPTKQKCNDFYPKYALCMMFRWYDPRWSSMTILMLYDAMVLAYKLFAYLFLLLKSLFGSLCLSSFLMQCFTNQDSNCVCDDNLVTQKMIPRYATRWYGMYAMGSMITNAHKSRCRQYSKASLDR